MFRQLAGFLAEEAAASEGYQNTGGPAASALAAYMAQQDILYNEILPSAVPVAGTAPVPDAAINRAIQTATEPAAMAGPIGETAPFRLAGTQARSQAECKGASLDDLLRSQDPAKPVRCGWTYVAPEPLSPIPRLSEGALGTRNGAFAGLAPSVPSRWFWDLREAKTTITKDVCKSLRRCADVGQGPYKDCAFDTATNQGVPVGSPNSVARPEQCPPPPPPPPGPQPQPALCAPAADRAEQSSGRSAHLALPGADGRLSAACLKSLVGQGGCSAAGALSLALSAGAPTNYLAAAPTSLRLYQRSVTQPLNEQAWQQGRLTVDAALSEVRQIAATAAAQPATSAAGAAARDLCQRAGAIEQFDFCSEIADGTRAPFGLECTRKLFLQLGGQTAGKLYPSEATMASYYNKIATWGAVRQAINGLKATAKNGSLTEQAAALKSLYGMAFDLGWMNLPAKMTTYQITTGNRIVGIDSNNNIWRYGTARGWEKLDGQAVQVSIGFDGTVWCVDKNQNPYQWNEEGRIWQQIPGSVLKIAVVNGSNVWGYNNKGEIFQWNGRFWRQMPGKISKDITAGVDGSVFCVGYPVGSVFSWSGSTWNRVEGGSLATVSTGDGSSLWGVGEDGRVYTWAGRRWTAQPGTGLRTVAVGPGESPLVLGINGDGVTLMWVGGDWVEVASV